MYLLMAFFLIGERGLDLGVTITVRVREGGLEDVGKSPAGAVEDRKAQVEEGEREYVELGEGWAVGFSFSMKMAR